MSKKPHAHHHQCPRSNICGPVLAKHSWFESMRPVLQDHSRQQALTADSELCIVARWPVARADFAVSTDIRMLIAAFDAYIGRLLCCKVDRYYHLGKFLALWNTKSGPADRDLTHPELFRKGQVHALPGVCPDVMTSSFNPVRLNVQMRCSQMLRALTPCALQRMAYLWNQWLPGLACG